MDFRLELKVKPLPGQLQLGEHSLLIGSCFTEHMARYLAQHRFSVLENPHGILFNPASIAHAMEDYISLKQYQSDDLFFHDGLWQSWHHHGRFAAMQPHEALRTINGAIAHAHHFLQKANWLMITLGSAYVYRLKPDSGYRPLSSNRVVANCHKVSAACFDHSLMELTACTETLQDMVTALRNFNPSIKIIFTISPVRHYREGLVENNRSKATLHLAVAKMAAQFANVFYFPAYELIIDDLRDYRFFAEDMVHPNYLATQYVWEKFTEACIHPESARYLESIASITRAMQHRPRQPNSPQHARFLQSMLQQTLQLQQALPQISWHDALEYFGKMPSVD
ncbi:MAG: GSCFA domain-containing protein [Chitinophagaceae bacterium]|jgi:hypothetical protein|nr:GSCFA domain-containing protein [Chitinophagaceae bacterium]